MKYDNQLRYASEIVKKYDGKIPLSAWLKNYFRLNKQMGSNDRKTISEMVYGFYRLGGNVFESVEQRILSFISTSENLPAMKEYFFGAKKDESKISVDNIFPFKKYLSHGIELEDFSRSFLVQPDLFIRSRPGFKENVIKKLSNSNITFSDCGDNCIALPNSTKIDSILELDKEAVVQDKSSQETGEYMKHVDGIVKGIPAVWDCCAASGGKAILVHDIFKTVKLTVSDIRESIIHNLSQRFSKAGINNYKSFVWDLTDANTKIPPSTYDLVVADVPCSGSGTWSRTPEQLYFFNDEKINYYSQLQRKIVSTVIPSLKQGGFLLYITCSVFADENENNVGYLSEKLGLSLVKSGLIKGYNQKADTLFAALFINR